MTCVSWLVQRAVPHSADIVKPSWLQACLDNKSLVSMKNNCQALSAGRTSSASVPSWNKSLEALFAGAFGGAQAGALRRPDHLLHRPRQRREGELARLIDLGGGVYSGALTKQCTHLLLKHTDDGKASAKERCALCSFPANHLSTAATSAPTQVLFLFKWLSTCRAARSWKTVRIVWDAWLQDTLQAGAYRADERAYAVQPHPAAPLPQPLPAVGLAHGRPPVPPAGPPAAPRAPAAAASAGCSAGAGAQQGAPPATAASEPAAPPVPPPAARAEPARSLSEAQEPKR